MQRHDILSRRIEDLAVFLDPVAFEHGQDLALAKRRKAAWREATNWITCSPTVTWWSAKRASRPRNREYF
jgi:hypothetical protein